MVKKLFFLKDPEDVGYSLSDEKLGEIDRWIVGFADGTAEKDDEVGEDSE